MFSRTLKNLNIQRFLAPASCGRSIILSRGNELRKSVNSVLSSPFTTSRRPLSEHQDPHQVFQEATTYIDEHNIYQFLNKYDTFLVDCDGVLWGTDHVSHLPWVSTTINKLRNLNKHLFFITNNSLHSREEYIEKFHELGAFHADIKDVYCVAYSAAAYLKDIAKVKGKCYIVGSEGMKRELDQMGIENIGFGPDPDKMSDNPHQLLKQMIDPSVDSVLVGFDLNFCYNKMYKAASYLSDPECHFVATNDLEVSLAIGPRNVQPLTGSLVKAISTAAKREPTVIGKPHGHLMKCILDTHPEIDLERTVMIGDSLRADIKFAINAGINSALVLSGAVSDDRLHELLALPKAEQGPMPTYVLPSLAYLGEFI